MFFAVKKAWGMCWGALKRGALAALWGTTSWQGFLGKKAASLWSRSGTDRLCDPEWQQPGCRERLETKKGQILKHLNVSFRDGLCFPVRTDGQHQ